MASFRFPRRGIGSLSPQQQDVLLAVGLGLGSLIESLGSAEGWSLALAPLIALPLALRRRAPLVMAAALFVLLVVGEIAFTTSDAEGGFLFSVAVLLIAMYSTAAYEDSMIRALSAGVLVAVGANWDLVVGGLSVDDFWPFRFLFMGGAWIGGRIAHWRHLEVGKWSDEARRLSLTQEERARQAVADERARLARELHDVIAHNVSVMVVQAGAAEQVLPDGSPGDVRMSLTAIQDRGRETIAELRRLLGILRVGDREMLTTPQPSLARLDVLVENARSSGLSVDVSIDGEPVALPSSIDLSAYRIVQEALTNVLKHARATEAHVGVVYLPGRLALEVVDNGAGQSKNGGRGHGLVGMKERVELFSGTLAFGPRPEGGFGLRAELPLTTVDSR